MRIVCDGGCGDEEPMGSPCEGGQIAKRNNLIFPIVNNPAQSYALQQ